MDLVQFPLIKTIVKEMYSLLFLVMLCESTRSLWLLIILDEVSFICL